MRRYFFLLPALLFVVSCSPGQIFGPPTEVVSIQANSHLEDAVLIYVNSEPVGWLTKDHPTQVYRVEIQVVIEYSVDRDWGTVYVQAWCERLGLSRTKQRTAYTDRIASFDFFESDFPK